MRILGGQKKWCKKALDVSIRKEVSTTTTTATTTTTKHLDLLKDTNKNKGYRKNSVYIYILYYYQV